MVITPLKDLEGDLQEVEDVLLGLLERRGAPVRMPAAQMFRTGGKRLRPALVLLCSRLFGPQPPAAVTIGAAVEMVHGASLLHDDVIDQTTVRRGKATMNALHGNRFSVLLGDFLLCESLLAVAALDQVELVRVVSESVAQMTMGQILELAHQGDLTLSQQDYLRIVEGKTAALMVCACKLGGLLGGADRSQVQALDDFGRCLGIAFQIVDDVLDFWGDPAVLGKPVGSDLTDRKYTLPVLVAVESSLASERERVAHLLSNGKLANGGLQDVVGWMDAHQARGRSMELARGYADRARQALRSLPPSQARSALDELLDYILTRDR
ncbi:MAG: polyprenyl synthetase family protein [Candidatus Eremiobacterota bacterium]